MEDRKCKCRFPEQRESLEQYSIKSERGEKLSVEGTTKNEQTIGVQLTTNWGKKPILKRKISGNEEVVRSTLKHENCEQQESSVEFVKNELNKNSSAFNCCCQPKSNGPREKALEYEDFKIQDESVEFSIKSESLGDPSTGIELMSESNKTILECKTFEQEESSIDSHFNNHHNGEQVVECSVKSEADEDAVQDFSSLLDDYIIEETISECECKDFKEERSVKFKLKREPDECDSSAYGEQDSSTNIDVEPTTSGLEILENALDDWYRRLVEHGPVADSKILKAAIQLSQSFNIDFSPGVKWVEDFKTRQGINRPSQVDSSPKLDVIQLKCDASSVKVKGAEPEHTEPPAKRMRLNDEGSQKYPKQIRSSHFLLGSDVDKLVVQLVNFHSMSEDRAGQWLNWFLSGLTEWLMSASSSRLGVRMFQVRLKVATLAKDMGNAGFTLNDAFYVQMKIRRPDLFANFDKKCLRSTLTPLGDEVAEWYDGEASSRLVSPGELERKARELAESRAGESSLPKDFLNNFVESCGLYCDLNGVRTLFIKPEVGLLGCRFEAEFLTWYYSWPVRIDNAFVDECNLDGKAIAVLESYLAALTEWFLERPSTSTLSAAVMKTQEELVAKVICSSVINMKDWGEWYEKWSEKTRRVFDKIRHFISTLEAWYKKCSAVRTYVTFNGISYKVSRFELQRKAEEIASRGLEFQPTKSWLKNFVERSGLELSDAGNSPTTFDADFQKWLQLSKMNVEESSAKYEKMDTEEICLGFKHVMVEHNKKMKEWYVAHSKMGVVHCSAVRERAEEIAHSLGMSKFSADKIWIKNFVKSLGQSFCGLVFSKPDLYFACSLNEGIPEKRAEVLTISQFGEQDVADLQEQLTAYPKQQLMAREIEFDDALGLWYVGESLIRTVLPGELEKKAMDIAQHIPLPKFVPDKRWVEAFIIHHGLSANIGGNHQLFKKAEIGLLKKKFDAEFLAWYHQWPLSVDDCIEHESSRCMTFFKTYLTDMLDTYMKEPKMQQIRLEQLDADVRNAIVSEVSGSRDFKEVMFAIFLESLRDNWCAQFDKLSRTIRGFDARVVREYSGNEEYQKSYEELKKLAEITAEQLGLLDFNASKSWLKRFVELNGFNVVIRGDPAFITAVDIMYVYSDVFDELFDTRWNQGPTGSGVMGKTNKHQLHLKAAPSRRMPRRNSSPSGGAIKSSCDVEEFALDYTTLIIELSKWYNMLSTYRTVTAGEYQIMALEISKGLDQSIVDSIASKEWLKLLVRYHGLWFVLNDERRLFLPAKYGILRWSFEAVFEAWYYGYPTDLQLNADALRKSDAALIQQYLKALFKWYLVAAKTRRVSRKEIEDEEIEIATSMNDTQAMPDVFDWCEKWILKCQSWIENFEKLDPKVESWYHAKGCRVKAAELSNYAESAARGVGIPNFRASKSWVKRFVELHGLCVFSKDTTSRYNLRPTSSPYVVWRLDICSTFDDLKAFNRRFKEWYSIK